MTINFRYFEPSTIGEACQLVSKYKDKAKILAGGTDLIIQMKRKTVNLKYLVNIKKIPNIDHIIYENDILRIGALVTHKKLIDSAIIQKNFNILREACLAIGTVQIRNIGTLVGNICNASPSGDTIPPLIALGAKVKCVSLGGERAVLLEDFITGPFQTLLRFDEVVVEVEIPPIPSNEQSVYAGCYAWVPKITATDETLVGVAVFLEIDQEMHTISQARIALGSVAPTPLRAKEAEKFLLGKKIDLNLFDEGSKIASKEIAPRSRVEYRYQLCKILTENSLKLATERALKGLNDYEKTDKNRDKREII